MRIRLSDDDRKRYGCDEWISYDPSRMGLREAAALKRATGYTPERLAERLTGIPQFDQAGDQKMRPVLDEAGRPVLDESGAPRVEPDLLMDFEAYAALVWMALRRAGVSVPYDDDFDIDVSFDVDVEPGDDDLGKDPRPPTTQMTT